MSSQPSLYAVVPAAGVGTRVGSELPKQYLSIAGKTIIEHTLEKLLAEPRLQRIVVSLNANDEYWRSLDVFKQARIETVAGGSERSDSVLNGLQHLSAAANPDDWVLVHDVARPCVSLNDISDLISKVQHHKVGGILAQPVSDTIKQVDDNAEITATIDRNMLWRAQTPQMFRIDPLLQALEQALAEGIPVTDEASAMELVGCAPLIIPGTQSNIKITCADDLALADYYLTKALNKENN